MDTNPEAGIKSLPLLVAIAGPTGSGKSELALRIAAEYAGEVVNCDSVQIYRGFDLGSAKLPVAERRGIPHHLIDIAGPTEIFTAGEFARRAREALSEISGRGKTPVVVGGTGLYLRALLDGLTPSPARDPELRERLAWRERKRPGSLHRMLRRLDGATASGIHPHDIPKIMRALEIRLLSGAPASLLFRRGKAPLAGFRVLKIALFPRRDELYGRLDRRCRWMFESGLIYEVQSLLRHGVPEDSKPMRSVGYSQALRALRGEIDFEAAIKAAQQATRNYAKRQITWFRREPELTRFEGFGEEQAIQSAAIEAIVKIAVSVRPPVS